MRHNPKKQKTNIHKLKWAKTSKKKKIEAIE